MRKNTVTVTLKNNGTEKVLYGINLDDPDARVYVYLELGETKEVKVQSTNAYTTIDCFLDSCYYGDPYAPEKDSYSGNVDILSVAFADEASELTDPVVPVEKDITASLTFEKAAATDPTTIENNKITWTDFAIGDGSGNWNAGFKANYDMQDGETTIKLTLKNKSDHAVRVQASLRNIAWNPEFGSTGLVIAAGAEATITITLTAEETAQVGIISFYCELWANWSDDYDQRPTADTVSGSLEIVSVKVS